MSNMVDWIIVGNNYWPVHFLLWWYFLYYTVYCMLPEGITHRVLRTSSDCGYATSAHV